MAKKTGYVSKGQRPNVSKTTLKGMRKDRLFSFESLRQSQKARELIKSSYNKKDKVLADRYKQEDEIKLAASRLMTRFAKCGLQWSTAVQAAKTNYIEEVTKKWTVVLRNWTEEQRKNSTLATK